MAVALKSEGLQIDGYNLVSAADLHSGEIRSTLFPISISVFNGDPIYSDKGSDKLTRLESCEGVTEHIDNSARFVYGDH
ncbi:hypothetical protein CWC46_21555 [Prodigiosinella confusarubida]|uniref:Uncharacterized protein n=1 Tax=Serratia sp. (strain ATCC 39006) TaxID=104623 RepID=A0A2I5TC46_SERS3|nr:hypothetical protein CWC46_21555 [Serratia sp. ATCC 39006]AUH06469.1 hypothetical protein Ser39006_021545 [Serratia sp. ATCC 39006]